MTSPISPNPHLYQTISEVKYAAGQTIPQKAQKQTHKNHTYSTTPVNEPVTKRAQQAFRRSQK